MAGAEPFDEPFEEPVEESTTAATSPEEVSPGAEPATSVAAAEREPAEPGAGEQTVLEQTAPHRPSEHTRPEQEETPLEHDAAGRERTARLEPAPARTAASARIDDDGGGRAVVDPRADAPAVLVDDGTAVGAVPQRLPATSALAEVILDKPIWIRTADGNLYPAPMHPAYGLSWGYPGGGPSALALLIHRLLDDITAPPVEYPGDAPGGLDELTERPWPCGTVLPRPLLEAARDGRPYDHP